MDAKKLKSRAIYVTKHGSHAYGLNTPTSDLDIKGVLIAERPHYLGFLHRVEQIEERDPNDLVIYELTKFFKLAADCNPNIIEVLWTEPEDILYMNSDGDALRDLRADFLSQKAKFTFSGYAMAQLKRMKNHHSWMKNPPTPPKSRAELGLPQNKDWGDWIELADRDNVSVADIRKWETEKEWREDSKKWAHYQEWLAGRNVKRHELEAKFGYDTKHGMHLVRLLRMGEEILKTGKVNVKRPDREELLAIRNNGIWSYEQMVEYAEQKDRELDLIYKLGTSPLPKEPNRKMLDDACQELVWGCLVEGSDGFWDGNVT